MKKERVGTLANVIQCNGNKTLSCYLVHEHFCFSHIRLDFHKKYWLFNNNDNNYHDPTVVVSFLVFYLKDTRKMQKTTVLLQDRPLDYCKAPILNSSLLFNISDLDWTTNHISTFFGVIYFPFVLCYSTVSHFKWNCSVFQPEHLSFRMTSYLSHCAFRDFTVTCCGWFSIFCCLRRKQLTFVLACWQILRHKPTDCLQSQMWKVMMSVISTRPIL